LIFHTKAEGKSVDFSKKSISFSATAERTTQTRKGNENKAQQFVFKRQVRARYIAMRIDSNYGGARYGLGEVRFTSGAPVLAAAKKADIKKTKKAQIVKNEQKKRVPENPVQVVKPAQAAKPAPAPLLSIGGLTLILE